MMKRCICAATLLTAITIGLPALAQQAAATGEASTSIGATTTGSATGDATPPPMPPPPPPPEAAAQPAPAAAPPPPAGESDHDAMVGRLAIGYLGYTAISYGAMADAGANANQPPIGVANAPIIGVRYWLDSSMGIDAGLGLTTTFGTHDVAGTESDAAAPTGLALHFGLPLALKSVKHYSFQIIPEANFGYASAGAGPIDRSGVHFDLGARAGAEIHFGFIGIPELSLVGSVGMRLDIESTKTEGPDGAGGTTTNKDSRWVLHSTVNDNPWNIFVGNISALYYL